MADKKVTLSKLNKNLNILKEREAKYAGNPPLELLNQIEDHEQAIALTRQAITGEITEVEWDEALKPLTLAITKGQVVHIEADIYVAGDLQGDIVSGDKIVTHIYPATNPRIPLQRPPRADHFIGRKPELTQLLSDLQPGRVVTLCGPGGIGKSALAAEAVWTLAPGENPPARFPDGIIFHSFASQPHVEVALEHIARTFGEEPKPTSAAAAQRALAGRRSLLVLDSAEEADNLPAIYEVRGECGVLVTSRRRQDAQVERQDIRPLDPGEAIELLQVWGGSQATDGVTVKRIADLVGRLPLAVRLVGRYLEQTGETAAEYLEWLEETPLEALSQGEHRDENVIRLLEHSLAQVNITAQQVLAVAGVLAFAPFDRNVIGDALEKPNAEVRRILNQLISYGLLQRDEDLFEMSHGLIHTYARRRLAAPEKVLNRVAEYYTNFAKAQSKLGPEGYDRLDRERVHILHVLADCLARKLWDETIGLGRAVQNFLIMKGYTTDRIITLEMSLTAAQNTNQPDIEGAFLIGLGDTYRSLSRIDEAIDYYEQALKLVRGNGRRHDEGIALGGLGVAYRQLGQADKAIEHCTQALSIAREINNRQEESFHLGNLGMAYHDLGQVKKAIEYWEQALAIDREIGDRRLEGRTLNSLGMAYNILGQTEKAVECLNQALLINREIGARSGEGDSLDFLGNVYQRPRRVEKAIDYHEQALAISREIGHRRGEGIRLGNLGRAYLKLERVDKAINYHEQALEIARQIGDRLNEAISFHNLGQDYQAYRHLDKAVEHLEQGLAIVQEAGYRGRTLWILSDLGKTHQDLGQIEKAIEYHEQALAIAREIGNRHSEGFTLDVLGKAYAHLGQMDRAIEYCEGALAIAQETGNRRFESFLRLVRLGNIKLRMKRFDEALTVLDQGLELNPDDEWGYSNWGYYERGLIHLVKNDPDQSERDFFRAIDLAHQTYEDTPQNWRNTLNLALYTLASGKTEAAIQLYQEAVEGQPPQALVREAIDDLEIFLNLFPDHSHAQAIRELLQQHLN